MMQTKLMLPKAEPQFTAADNAKTPALARKLGKWLFILFFLLPIGAMFLPWLQNIQGKGTVTAYHPNDRQQNVEAPISGVVSHWYVQEGSHVKKGDVLLEMTDVDPQFKERLNAQLEANHAKLNAKEGELKSYETQLNSYQTARDAKTSAATYKRDAAKQKVLSATEAIHAAEANVQTTQLQLNRMQRLLNEGLVSKRDVEVAERDSIVANRTLNTTKAQLDAAHAEERSANAEITQIRADAQSSIDSANAQVNKIRSEIADSQNSIVNSEVNIARQRAQKVTAPRDGTVFRLPANTQSQMISRGQALLIVVPENNDRAVELYIDGRDAPLVVKNSEVRLEFEGWPAAQVAGWPNASIGTFVGKVAFVDATDDGTGKFRVMVKPDESQQTWPDKRFLRQGSSVRGWILLQQVSLGYELWRLLNGFPPRLPPETSAAKSSTAK